MSSRPPGFLPAVRLSHRRDRDQGGDHAERHVDEEDPAPVQVLADQAADRRAERQAEGADRAPDADRGGPLPRVGERRRDDRQGGGHQHRRAEALHRPGGDQHPGAAREPGRQRGQREDGQADEEHPAPADQVRDPAADEQQAAEYEQVAAHDPLKAADRYVQAVLDRRQRHVDHVVIKVSHERCEADRCQRPPASPCGHWTDPFTVVYGVPVGRTCMTFLYVVYAVIADVALYAV
jgi:hypothetical protein